MSPKVIFISKSKAEAFTPPANSHLISISDMEQDAAQITSSDWQSVSFHYFVDADYDEEVIQIQGEHFKRVYQSYIMPEKADELRNRIQMIVESSPELIVVNCKAGKSRSAAVAKYISDTYGYELEGDLKYYNHTVYRLLNNDHQLICAINYASPPQSHGEEYSIFQKVLNFMFSKN